MKSVTKNLALRQAHRSVVHSSTANSSEDNGDNFIMELPQKMNFTTLVHQDLESSPERNVDIVFDGYGIPVTQSNDRTYETAQVPMLDGRKLATSLDKEGIVLSSHCYPHVDYYDHKSVLQSYYPELQQHIQQLIPCARRVIVFHHQVRSWRKSVIAKVGDIIEKERSSVLLQRPKDPVCFAHSDYSLKGGISRLQSFGQSPLPRDSWGYSTLGRPLLTDDEVNHFSSTGDFMILHAWRNIAIEKLRQHPLALCCSDSVNENDLLAYDLCYPDRKEGVMAVRYNQRQKWLYHKDLDRDELLLFKQYDTRSTIMKKHNRISGHSSKCDEHHSFTSCFTPHSSFLEARARDEQSDDTHYDGRESIEAAVLVLLS